MNPILSQIKDPGSGEAFKDDPICSAFLANKEVMAQLDKTASLESACKDPSKYDVVFCAGGHGPMFDLPDCEALQKVTAAVYEKGGIASAVCHGPAGQWGGGCNNRCRLVVSVFSFGNQQARFFKPV